MSRRARVLSDKKEFLRTSLEKLRASQIEHPEKYLAKVDGVDFWVLPGVFSPAYFMGHSVFYAKAPSRNVRDFLEIGTGAGYLAILAALQGRAQHVVATDINPVAVENARLNVKYHNLTDRVEVFEGDLFDAVPKGRTFDSVGWNFPFLYQDIGKPTILERSIVDIGYNGLWRFMNHVSDYLRPEGFVNVAFSPSIGDKKLFDGIIRDAGFNSKIVVSKKVPKDRFQAPIIYQVYEMTRKK
jgi:release factor glutamine methyltransferase